MRRDDVTVLSISAALVAVAIGAVTFSVVVLDRTPSAAAFDSGDAGSSWLVVTWAPSLCRVEPSAAGCASGRIDRMGPTMLLHGLWPQPATNQYCDVPKPVADQARKMHGDMPAVDMQDNVRADLQSVMGDVAVMAPHEWYAHGTCSGVTPDVYFDISTELTDQARQLLNPTFVAAEGDRLTRRGVRDLFDAAFGDGAGDRVRLTCRNVPTEGNVIFEVQMSLPAVTALTTPARPLSLEDLFVDAPPISGGCSGGRVP